MFFNVALVILVVLVLMIVSSMFLEWRLKRTIADHRSRAVAEPADEVVQRVKCIVAENRCMAPDDIFLDMLLRDELGMDGDDASDLFEDLAKDFPDVDLSKLDLSLYFGPEGVWAPRRRHYFALRVADLVQAAREKRWQSP